jgi:hypothetical protein
VALLLLERVLLPAPVGPAEPSYGFGDAVSDMRASRGRTLDGSTWASRSFLPPAAGAMTGSRTELSPSDPVPVGGTYEPLNVLGTPTAIKVTVEKGEPIPRATA